MLDEFRLDRGLAIGHALHSALVLLLELSGVCVKQIRGVTCFYLASQNPSGMRLNLTNP